MSMDVSGGVQGGQAFAGYAVDESGSPFMNVDGSQEAKPFSLVCPDGYHLGVTHINLVMGFEVLEVPEVSMMNFGSLDALANGIKFEAFHDETGLIDATQGFPWKSNADLLLLSTSSEPMKVYQLNGDMVLIYNYPMTPALATDCVEFHSGSFVRYTIQDDLSDLHMLRITVFGILCPDALC